MDHGRKRQIVAFVARGEGYRHYVLAGFDFVQKKTDAMAAKGQIRPEHAPRVRRFLDTCRTLTPQQRELFVDLINRDLELASPKKK